MRRISRKGAKTQKECGRTKLIEPKNGSYYPPTNLNSMLQTISNLFATLRLCVRIVSIGGLLTMTPGINSVAGAGEVWKPASAPLLTKWAKDVSAEHARPEYPRPLLVR